MINSYPLGHDLDEMARLETQSRLLEDELLTDLAKKSHRILEVGCGVGSNWPLIRNANYNANYLGIDFSETAIHEADSRYSGTNAHFKKMDATLLSLPSESFDLVFSKLVLWSIGTKWENAVSEAFRVLSTGGYFYALEPFNRLITFEPPRPYTAELIRGWDNEALKKGCDPSVGPKVPKALKRAGFKDIQAKAFPVLALAGDKSNFNAVCDNLRRFLLSDSPGNPASVLETDLKIKARQEFETIPEDGLVMDFLFVSWGQK